LIIAGVIYGGYRHYNGLVERAEAMERQNEQLLTAVNLQHDLIAEQSAAIDDWKEAQRELQARLEEMARVAYRASEDTRKLQNVFAKRDLGVLASKKPGLIQRRLTDGSNRTLRMFECATGAGGPDC
jgi:chromosome segregation ATPase